MSASTATKDSARGRLFSPVALLLTGVLLVLLFAAVFITSGAGKRPAVPANGASVDYLKTLLRADPQDRRTRIELTRQLISAGEIEEAQQQLAPLRNAGDDEQVLRLQTDLDWQMFTAAAADSQRRAALATTLNADLDRLQQRNDLSIDDLQMLVQRRLALNQPAAAAALDERLAQADPQQAYAHLENAARAWLAANQPLRARDAWQAALASAATPEQAHGAAMESLRAARAGEDVGSVEVARKLVERRPGDAEVMSQSIDIALANQRPDIALEWSQQWLTAHPDDDQALLRQSDIGLALGRPDIARQAYQLYASRHPDDIAAQKRLAQLDQWSGRPQLALSQLQALARAGDDESLDRQIVQLAQDRDEPTALAEALGRIAKRGRLSAKDMQLYVDTLDAEFGRPRDAIAALRGWLRPVPEHQPLWQKLADLYDQTDQPEAALQTWERIAAIYGRSGTETQARALLQIGQWRLGDALKTLLSLANPPRDAAYWKRIGELAWARNDMDNSRRAYGWLYEQDRSAVDDEAAQRLVLSLLRGGELDRATEIAIELWRSLHDPQLIIDALAGASQARRLDLSERLLTQANGDLAAFDGNAGFWQLRGDYYSASGDGVEALRSYRTALQISPDDSSVQAAYLYALIEQDQTAELRRFLLLLQPAIADSPELWEPYALGYVQLGQPQIALPWFARRAVEQPNDYLWLLGYADALDATRRHDSAYRIRLYALSKLRPRLFKPYTQPPSVEQREADDRALAAQQNLIGAQEDLAWMRRVIGTRDTRSLSREDLELLMDWQLLRGRPAAAQRLQMRAQLLRLRTAPYLQLTVALNADDRAEIARVLEASQNQGITDRVEALRRVGKPALALALSLNHLNDREPWAPGIETLPKYAAELYREMPQNAGLQLRTMSLSGMHLSTALASAKLSSEHWTLEAKAGGARLTPGSMNIDLDGLDYETSSALRLTHRQQWGITSLQIGHVETDAVDFSQFDIEQSLRVTERLTALAFGHLHEQTLDTAQLRALGTRSSAGLGFEYTLSSRDTFQFSGQGQRYQTRDGDKLADGYGLQAEFRRALLIGRNYEVQGRVQSEYQRNHLVDALPGAVAARLPAGAGVGDLVPGEFGNAGVGLSIEHGLPGDEYPQVGALRYVADFDVGYVWPDRRIGVSIALGAGIPLLGSDELSVYLGYDQTQTTTAGSNRSLGLQYRYYFGK